MGNQTYLLWHANLFCSRHAAVSTMPCKIHIPFVWANLHIKGDSAQHNNSYYTILHIFGHACLCSFLCTHLAMHALQWCNMSIPLSDNWCTTNLRRDAPLRNSILVVMHIWTLCSFHCRYAIYHIFTRHIFAHSMDWLLFATVWICSRWAPCVFVPDFHITWHAMCFLGLHVFITSTLNSYSSGACWITLPL